MTTSVIKAIDKIRELGIPLRVNKADQNFKLVHLLGCNSSRYMIVTVDSVIPLTNPQIIR